MLLEVNTKAAHLSGVNVKGNVTLRMAYQDYAGVVG